MNTYLFKARKIDQRLDTCLLIFARTKTEAKEKFKSTLHSSWKMIDSKIVKSIEIILQDDSMIGMSNLR